MSIFGSGDLPDGLRTLFGASGSEERGEKTPNQLNPDVAAEVLLDLHRQLAAPRRFAPGDLITQPVGLQRYHYPERGVAARFERYLTEGEVARYVERADDAGDWIEPPDCVVHVLIPYQGENRIVTLLVASARFVRWERGE